MWLILFAFWAITIVNFIINLIYLYIVSQKSEQLNKPISIIIPCRNEENNLNECLNSALKVKESNTFLKEIIVINDNSTDGTPEIISKFKNKIKVLNLKEKPEDWMGKNYACYEGAKLASSDYILFIDADVRLQKLPLIKENFDLVSYFLKQNNESFWEKVMVPFRVNFLALFILPMSLLNKIFRKKALWANGFGFMMLVKRSSYFETGGHEAVKNEVIEDIKLAKMFVEKGYKIAIQNGNELAEIRMYRNFGEIWKGFEKNYYYNFGKSVLNLILLWFVIFNFLICPFFVLQINLTISLILIFITIVSLLYLQVFTYRKFSIIKLIELIVGFPVNFLCSLESFRKGIFKIPYEWKGRKITS